MLIKYIQISPQKNVYVYIRYIYL